MQHQDKTSDNCTTDECQLSRCCWCFWTRRDETRQLQKADCVEISGSGRQVADRHVCDQGEREGISTRTERLWSGCGRPAATGHIVPMAHSWTSMSGCQVSKRSPVGTPRCWYRLLAVYINRRLSGESLHRYHFRVPPPPIHLTHLYASSQVTTQNGWLTAVYSWDSIVHRKPYKKCIHCPQNKNQGCLSTFLCTNMIHVSK